MTQATMHVKERSEAIQRAQRAQRALKALGEHPRSSKKELGHVREHVNACYSHGSGEYVWNAVAQVEAMAVRRHGVPSTEEQRQLVEANETSRSLRQPPAAARRRSARSHRPRRPRTWTALPLHRGTGSLRRSSRRRVNQSPRVAPASS